MFNIFKTTITAVNMTPLGGLENQVSLAASFVIPIMAMEMYDYRKFQL